MRLENKQMKEKIAAILKPLTKSYVLSYIHNLNQLEKEIERVESCYLDQIIVLFEEVSNGISNKSN